MGSYIINKIYLENFKIYDKIFLDIGENNRLFILDGPNGFGKTSIFDCIELILTGEISRLSATKTDTYESPVICKNPQKDMVIIVEFKSKEKDLVICKRIKKIESLKKHKINNPLNLKDLCETYELEDIHLSEDLDLNSINWSKQKSISQDFINETFNNNLNQYYKDYYYIPQENRLHFLNKNHKERMNVISDLMNITKYEEIVNKTKKARDNSNKIKKELEKEHKNLDSKNIKLNKNKKELNYKRLIPWKQDELSWDLKDLTIGSEENKLRIIDNIYKIKTFLDYYNDFCNDKFNKKIDYFLENMEFIMIYLKYRSHSNKSYYDIEKEFFNLKELKILQENLKLENIREYKKIINTNLKEYINVDDLYDHVDLLEELKDQSNKFTKLLNDLMRFRRNIEETFLTMHKHNYISESQCPLCGYDWCNITNLLESTKKKEIEYESYQNINSKKITKLENYIQSKYIEKIHEYTDECIKRKYNIESMYKDIKILKEKNFLSNDFEELIEKEPILRNAITRLIVENENSNIFENKDIDLFKIFTSTRKELSAEYKKEKSNLNFENVYKHVFENDDLNVKALKHIDISNKIKYINDLFLNEELDLYNMNLQEQKKIEKQILIMDSIYKDLKNMYDIYSSKVKFYKSQLIKEIEIPFYLYSGRILQNYGRGNGILISEEVKTGLNKVKFISSHDSEHDVLNCMSSGQLSAIVLSFTLALNRVYHKGNFTTILIDDPIQTMDEINIASFVDILRNEFSNKQLIISTHDEEFSRYIAYKFKKYGYNYKMFNVKDEINKLE